MSASLPPLLAPGPLKAELLTPLRERPQVLLRELAWRWLCGGLLLLLAGYEAARIWSVSRPAVEATGLFSLNGDSLLQDPSQLATAFSATVAVLRPQVEHAAFGLAPLAVFCWVLAFALGRNWVLARWDPRLLRRPWLLAQCEALRIGAMLGASLLWGWLVQMAAAVALRGASPNGLLYGVLALAATALVLLLWSRTARTIEGAMALALVEPFVVLTALGRAWRSAQPTAVRRAASRARLLLLVAAFLFTFLPAPFSTGWPLFAWWCALSLVLLAGADAVRLGVLFALIGQARAAALPRIAALPREAAR